MSCHLIAGSPSMFGCGRSVSLRSGYVPDA
jgi:hypothetical protein